MKNIQRLMAVVLTTAVVATSPVATADVSAKAKKANVISLSSKKVSLSLGNSSKSKTTLKIKVKKGYSLKSKKFTVKKKGIVTVSKKGVITAKNAGSTIINVTVKYKKKGAKKVSSKKLTCKVTVASASSSNNKAVSTTSNSNNSSANNNSSSGKNNDNGTNSGNITDDDYYDYEGDDEDVIVNIKGLALENTTAPSRADYKYVKTINLGAYSTGNVGYSRLDKLTSDITGDVYLMKANKKGDGAYCLFIKSNKDDAIIGYYESIHETFERSMRDNGKENHLFCVVFENKVKANMCSHLFDSFLDFDRYSTAIKHMGIYNIENLDTSDVKDFIGTFKRSYRIYNANIDFYLPDSFDISKATILSDMFEDFGFLDEDYPHHISVTLPESFDTSNVQFFDGMFSGCDINDLNLPASFVFNPSKVLDVGQFFYASYVEHINNKTPFNTSGCKDTMCIPRGGTFEDTKKYIDQLDFSSIESTGLTFYGLTDSKIINYGLEKMANEATSIPNSHMTCCNIKTDDIVVNYKNVQVTYYKGYFEGSVINSVTIINGTIADARGMFEECDVKIIDLSASTFLDGCLVERMFYYWKGESVPTIYVKDSATQKLIIDAYNADNADAPIDETHVIIK
ncbi:MAG: DUF285 domain-containing protein [Lachnospiraceae bacterium]|nr:DUF285 domain-containing protein [Lachnospiraceae bacterium]